MINKDDPLNKFAELYLKYGQNGAKVRAKRELNLSDDEIKHFLSHYKKFFKVIANGYPPERYELNKKFEKEINSTSALEPFAGSREQYQNSITNDTESRFNAQYQLDAMKFLEEMLKIHGENSFDLVDIDPFSYSVPYFEIGCKLAKKGIVVHVGDLWYLAFNKNKLQERYEFAPKSASGNDLDAISYHFYIAAKLYGKNLVKYDEYKKRIVAKVYYKIG